MLKSKRTIFHISHTPRVHRIAHHHHSITPFVRASPCYLYNNEDPVEDVDRQEAEGEEPAAADVDPLGNLRRRHLDERSRKHGRAAHGRATPALGLRRRVRGLLPDGARSERL